MDDRSALPADGLTILGQLTLPARPDHVCEARLHVLKALRGLHPRVDDAVLMTSELVTNAVLHTNSRLPGGTVVITILEAAGGVRIEVADAGSELTAPAVRSEVYSADGLCSADGLYSADGHGLLLVQNLADQWGYLRAETGTTVWFWLGRR